MLAHYLEEALIEIAHVPDVRLAAQLHQQHLLLRCRAQHMPRCCRAICTCATVASTMDGIAESG